MKTFNIIAAYETNNRGIGYSGKLPWPTIKSDMQRFRSLTMGNIVVMGNATFASLGHRRLPDRMNIILSRTSKECNYRNSLYEVLADNNLNNTLHNVPYNGEIFIIGGQQIYENAICNIFCKNIYITEIDGDFTCDRFFPEIPDYFRITSCESKVENGINMRFLTYESSIAEKIHNSMSEFIYDISKLNIHNNHDEMQYLQLIREIMETGERKNGRNGVYISKFGIQHKFNLSDGFPLLTTKRMFVRGIVEELLFFLRGDTNTNLLADKGINIWKANTTSEFHKKCGLEYEPGDMGPMYGYNWRYFGKKYTGMNMSVLPLNHASVLPLNHANNMTERSQHANNMTNQNNSVVERQDAHVVEQQDAHNANNMTNQNNSVVERQDAHDAHHDQLRTLLTGLKNDPFSRRHLLTTYDPSTVSQCVLPPCHGLIVQFYVRTSPSHNSVNPRKNQNNSAVNPSKDYYLDCKMYQRSVDVALGYPFNIASYAYLTYILCEVLGYKPGVLIMTLGDTHLYESHLDAIKSQISRTPFAKPQVAITKKYEGSTIDDMIDYIENLQYENFELKNYVYHPAIKMQMVA